MSDTQLTLEEQEFFKQYMSRNTTTLGILFVTVKCWLN